MTNDITKELPQSADEKLNLILTTVLSTSVRVDSIDTRLHRVETRLDRVEEGQRTLEEGQRVLDEGQRRLELGLEVLRGEVDALNRSVKHRFLVLSGQVQASYNTLEKRVTIMEANSNPPNSQT
jgi:septal ring factor EnvC (AmiA/AmiB activator)